MNLLNKIKNLGNEATSSHGQQHQDWYITAEGAEGLQDESMFSKADAYLKFEFGGKEVRTKAIKNDRTPNWNETFHFRLLPDHAKDIRLKVVDEDIGFDDGMGHAKISRSELPINPGEEKFLKVPIFHKDICKGVVRLRVKYLVETQPSQLNQGMMHQQQQYNQTQPMTQQPHYGQQQFMPQQQPQQPYMQQQPYGQTQQQPFGQSQQQPSGQSQQQPSGQSQQQQPFQQQSYGQHQQQPQSGYGQQRY